MSPRKNETHREWLMRRRAYNIAHRDAIRARQRAYHIAHPAERNARRRAQRAAHRDEIRAQRRAYYAAHRDEVRAYRRAYGATHRDEIRAQQRAYNAAHRKGRNEENRKRYALKRQAIQIAADRVLTHDQWEHIQRLSKGRCYWCNKKMQEITQDHVIPLSKGGLHTAENVVASCRSCNVRKGAKIVTLF